MAITKVSSGLISADASSIDLNIDAGTLYLDVSENKVGIGTSSPVHELTIGASGADAKRSISIEGTNGSSEKATLELEADGENSRANFKFNTGNGTGTTRMTIDSSGNVGIGIAPTKTLQIESGSTDDDGLFLSHSSGTVYAKIAVVNPGVDNDTVIGAVSNNNLKLITQNTERMRIDNSGNLLVGNTVVNPVSGFASQKGFGYAASTGKVEIATDANAAVMELGKNNSNDGSLLVFRKQSNTVGSLGVIHGNNLFIGAPSHSGLQFGTSVVYPTGGSTGDANDATIDIGASSQRFKDIYLSNTIGNGAGEEITFNNSQDYMSFDTSGSERMRIQSTGRTAFFQTTGGGAVTIRGEGGTSFLAISFTHDSDSGVGYIQTSSSSVTYSTSSDYRLKENVVPMENGLERIQKLKPVKFNWKLDGEESEGFLAHEVQEAGWDDGITGSKDDNLIEEGQQTYQGMDYGRITPLLVKAIQEQQTIIDDLKTRIETLENV